MAGVEDMSERVTTTSLDHHVARLEDTVNHLQESYNELDRKIDRVELEQRHLKELVDAKLATHDSKLDKLNLKIDTLVSGFSDFKIEITRTLGDVNATPAGRVISEEIEELKQGRKENADSIKKLGERLIFLSGALAVVVFIFNLIAPIILSVLNLPH